MYVIAQKVFRLLAETSITVADVMQYGFLLAGKRPDKICAEKITLSSKQKQETSAIRTIHTTGIQFLSLQT